MEELSSLVIEANRLGGILFDMARRFMLDLGMRCTPTLEFPEERTEEAERESNQQRDGQQGGERQFDGGYDEFNVGFFEITEDDNQQQDNDEQEHAPLDLLHGCFASVHLENWKWVMNCPRGCFRGLRVSCHARRNRTYSGIAHYGRVIRY